jgi:NAD(P)-dependent dehydrogenase (short-subunit alcohol dehydrogenase family)
VDLTNKIALVTGGKRIGAVVAVALAKRGVDVAVSYSRSRVEAEETAARVQAAGRRAHVVQADLSRPEACQAVVDEVADAMGGLDILVNMASVYERKAFDQLTVEDWDLSMNVDLRAAFLCARAAVPHLRRRGGGHIINASDWISRSGRPRYLGFLPYYVAKAGVIALTEALALELAGDTILVNAVALGPILAPPGMSDRQKQIVTEVTPAGRWGGEDEIASAVLGLLDSEFITGETIRVDGGRHLQ